MTQYYNLLFIALHIPTHVTKANKTFTRILSISNYHFTICMQSTTSNMSEKWIQYLVTSVFVKVKLDLFDSMSAKRLAQKVLSISL